MSQHQAKLEQARQHLADGRLNQAKAAVQRVLQAAPMDIAANELMRDLLVRQGQFAAALPHARRAHDGAPNDPHLAAEYGRLLAHLGQLVQGEALLRRATEAAPENAVAWHGLVAALLSQQKLAAGLEAADRAAELHSDHGAIRQQLASALLELGRGDEALTVLSGLLMESPHDAGLACGVANVANYAAGVSAARLEQAHRNAGRLVALQRHAAARPRAAREAGKPLRVGFLSADLYSHSVAYFLEPLLEHLDRARFEVVCFAAGAKEDATTARLKKHVTAWRRVAAMGDEQLAAQIAADRIDVLIETSGLTAGHRLGALLDRPAPVQMTWCGYPNTTGCGFIGVRVVDAITDPPGAESACTERLERLDDCFLCYRPEEEAPEVGPLPAEREGVVTFGSFNNFAKVNEPLLRLWARVLAAVSRSRLLLKAAALAEAGTRAFIAEWMADLGVARERLVLLEPTRGKREHLAAYGRVDIALDTFPYHGTTTTCEALWMGVPVITLMGDRHASRVGGSLLRAIGRPEWVAECEDGFVAAAAGLARDVAGLARVRAGLRGAVRDSVLCDGRAFAARFGAMIERAAGC